MPCSISDYVTTGCCVAHPPQMVSLSPVNITSSILNILPPEIITPILRYAIDPGSRSGANIVLTCKAFNDIGIEYLWEKLTLGSERSHGFFQSGAAIEVEVEPFGSPWRRFTKHIVFNLESHHVAQLIMESRITSSHFPHLTTIEFGSDISVSGHIGRKLQEYLPQHFTPKNLIWNSSNKSFFNFIQFSTFITTQSSTINPMLELVQQLEVDDPDLSPTLTFIDPDNTFFTSLETLICRVESPGEYILANRYTKWFEKLVDKVGCRPKFQKLVIRVDGSTRRMEFEKFVQGFMEAKGLDILPFELVLDGRSSEKDYVREEYNIWSVEDEDDEFL